MPGANAPPFDIFKVHSTTRRCSWSFDRCNFPARTTSQGQAPNSELFSGLGGDFFAQNRGNAAVFFPSFDVNFFFGKLRNLLGRILVGELLVKNLRGKILGGRIFVGDFLVKNFRGRTIVEEF